jgi:hypothetical protein
MCRERSAFKIFEKKSGTSLPSLQVRVAEVKDCRVKALATA